MPRLIIDGPRPALWCEDAQGVRIYDASTGLPIQGATP